MNTKGKKRRGNSLVQLDKKLLTGGVLILLPLAVVKFDKPSAFTPKLSNPSTFSEGQPVSLSTNFGHERGYIRYRIAGLGDHYWPAQITERFEVSWQRIAKLNQEDTADSKRVDAEGKHIEAGMVLKVPINQ
jgi:hypothetical protein